MATSLWAQQPDVAENEAAVGIDLLIKVKAVAEDRKSTRLNSSHVVSWYAVFGVKKKKKKKRKKHEKKKKRKNT